MRIYIVLIIFAGSLLFPISGQAGRRKLAVIDDEQFLEICGEYSGNKSATLRKNDRGRYATLYSVTGVLEGYFLITSDYSRPRGYHGATAVGLTLNPDGEILSARIVESADTKDYVKNIEKDGFLKNFAGLSDNNTLEVDTVSGATRTCDAIRNSIRNTLTLFKAMIIQSD